MRSLDEIIVHCSATPPSWRSDQTTEQKVSEIRRWHVEDNGWSDIGYHYLIDRDGAMAEGRPIKRPGAHVKGRNKTTIGICLLGGQGAAATDAFQDHFTPEQDRALRDLIAKLKTAYPTIIRVSGHNDHAAKGCPGFKVKPWHARKAPRTSPVQSKTLLAQGVQWLGASGLALASWFGAQSEGLQIAIVVSGAVIIVAGLVIFRERLRHWAEGVR